MIIEKIVPVNSGTYVKWKEYFIHIGEKIDSLGLIQLFTIWTLTVSGIVTSMDFQNRYVYWEWNGWMIGLFKLIVASFLFLSYLRPKKLWLIGTKTLSVREIILHLMIASLLFIFGYLDFTFFQSEKDSLLKELYLSNVIFSLSYYMMAFFSCLIVFQFTLVLDKEKGVWNNYEWENKPLYFSLSIISMFISIMVSISYEDPVASTASAVAIPYSIIALIWPNHVRHLQRARFYPIFTFAMFFCVLAPWFIIPLALLFFFIRTVNYFRFGIVYPSFGVDFLEEENV